MSGGELGQALRKVNDFVDDDLLSCFLWAAGENAIATPSWESPSVKCVLCPPLACCPLRDARQCSGCAFPFPSGDGWVAVSSSSVPWADDGGSREQGLRNTACRHICLYIGHFCFYCHVAAPLSLCVCMCVCVSVCV